VRPDARPLARRIEPRLPRARAAAAGRPGCARQAARDDRGAAGARDRGRRTRRAAALFPLADALRAQIESREQGLLYRNLEHPLIEVLYEMEKEGVMLDRAVIAEQSARFAEEIERLRGELLEQVGEEINLDSGPQIAQVLFEKLGLKPGGKTPGGALSTRSEVLEELARAHPFPAKLLEYRALTKLKSTYLDALPLATDPADGRVHTTYEQAGRRPGGSRPTIRISRTSRCARRRAARSAARSWRRPAACWWAPTIRRSSCA
jgi:DNA polymerase-1